MIIGSGRTGNAIRNAAFGTLSKILNLLLSFVSRTLFIYYLGDTYLGVNGLYSEILNLLSFAELGFGSAMTFAMYKPAAEQDEERLSRLLRFYKRIYRIVALVIAALGLCLLPFLQYIVKGADWLTLRELRSYFLIFLFNTVIGYFVSYKYSYLNALQKNYISTNIDAIVSCTSFIIQIIIITTTKSFLLYLLAKSAVLLLSRVVIVFYLDRKYPVLKKRPGTPLSKEEQEPIFHEVRGLVVHQFSSVAVHSTDNILISMLSGLGVVAVGYISNYNMLMNSVLGFVTILFSSVVSGFGNLVATSTTEHYHKVFLELNFLNFWVYGFCSICFWVLVPPFIVLWIGAEKLIDSISFTLIIVNCYLQGQSSIYHTVRIAKGNFNADKKWALYQALVNLVVSIVGAKYLGLVGIYIGTVVSRLVYMVFRPQSTYRMLFERSSAEYYKKLAIYFCATAFAACICKLVAAKILLTITIRSFVVAALTTAALSNLLFAVLFFRTEEFQYWKSFLLQILRKK